MWEAGYVYFDSATFPPAGDLGRVNLTFRSQSPHLCVQFSSDGLTELAGFNATYTKLYKDTNITGQSGFVTCQSAQLM